MKSFNRDKIICTKLNLKNKSLVPIPQQTKPSLTVENQNKDSPKVFLKTFSPKEGSGKIMISSRAVIGGDTKFISECKIGDELIIINPIKYIMEKRKINVIVSDTSLLVDLNT